MSVEVVTFGCRLNAFESEVIAREATDAGLTDTIVINSCAVTNEAVAQARQWIRRLKRRRPQARGGGAGWPGAAIAPRAQARAAAGAGRGDRLRGAGRARNVRRHGRGRSRDRQ